MAELIFLNKKEKKRIFDLLSFYGIEDFSIFDKYLIMIKRKKDGAERVYLMSEKFSEVNIENIRIDSMGLYFGEIKNNEFRLSIEGSQIAGKFSKRKLLLPKNKLNEYILGNVVEVDVEEKGFYIVTNGTDFFGTGFVKDGTLLNYYPKERRVGALHE